MRLLTILLVLIIGIVFFVQNQQAVTLVFFGNLTTLTLPIAGWVLLFVTAGAITSLLWRVILPSRKPSATRIEAERARPYTPTPSPPRTPIASDYRPPQDYVRSPVDTSVNIPMSSPQSDWEKRPPQEEWDDWEIENPSPEPVSKPAAEPSQSFEDGDRFQRKLEEDEQDTLPNFEVEQQPKTVTRTGSTYSYTYREPKDKPDKEKEATTKIQKEERKSDRVYDANYRVIRPPYRDNVDRDRQDEDNEDWI
jgi:uncharacterized integral membrane protein